MMAEWRMEEEKLRADEGEWNWNAQIKSESKRIMLMQSNCDEFVTPALTAFIKENKKKYEIMEKREAEIFVSIQIPLRFVRATESLCVPHHKPDLIVHGCHLMQKRRITKATETWNRRDSRRTATEVQHNTRATILKIQQQRKHTDAAAKTNMYSRVNSKSQSIRKAAEQKQYKHKCNIV